MSDDLVVAAVMHAWPGMSEQNVRVWREYTRGGHDHEIAASLGLREPVVRFNLGDLYHHLPCPRDRVSVAMYGLRTGAFELSPFSASMMLRRLSHRELNYVQAAADGLTNGMIGAEYERGVGSIAASFVHIARVVRTSRRVLIATRCYRAGLIA